MMRALFSGMTGLRNHQTYMDVIGNNIANVNTTGFKASRVTFKEAFVKLLQGATLPLGSEGGTNPMEIGSGSSVESIDKLFTQGTLQTTSQPLDLAIQGDTLFTLTDGAGSFYTRAGNFQLDAEGHLVLGGTSYVVQGRTADITGSFATSGLGPIQLQLGQKTPALATSAVSLGGSLDAGAAVGAQKTISITTYDSVGTPQMLALTFTKTGTGTWSWAASSPTAGVTPAGTGTVTFSDTGTLASFTYPGGGSNFTLTPANGAAAMAITINAGTVGGIDGLSSFAGDSSAVVSSQNGSQPGSLESISVDQHGVISGAFSNGVTKALAQVALTKFVNPAGLMTSGDGIFQTSMDSGQPFVGYAGSTITSSITPGALEGSNVDISQEFTDMIIAQRGFQANAKVITTADQMLNDLVNLRQ